MASPQFLSPISVLFRIFHEENIFLLTHTIPWAEDFLFSYFETENEHIHHSLQRRIKTLPLQEQKIKNMESI